VVAAFVELVTKLNDTAFRPLFRKLFDWAFTGKVPRDDRLFPPHTQSTKVAEASAERKITFCNTYVGLLDYFKVIFIVSAFRGRC
jgi:U3 small nucleolar RNA-associated protein 10